MTTIKPPAPLAPKPSFTDESKHDTHSMKNTKSSGADSTPKSKEKEHPMFTSENLCHKYKFVREVGKGR